QPAAVLDKAAQQRMAGALPRHHGRGGCQLAGLRLQMLKPKQLPADGQLLGEVRKETWGRGWLRLRRDRPFYRRHAHRSVHPPSRRSAPPSRGRQFLVLLLYGQACPEAVSVLTESSKNRAL